MTPDPTHLRQLGDRLEELGWDDAARLAREAADAIEPAMPRLIDRDGVLRAYPQFETAIRAWLDDPEPKLQGLTIEATGERRGPAYSADELPDLHIRFGFRRGFSRYGAIGVISGMEMRYGDSQRAISTMLVSLHRRVIQELRGATR